MNINEQVGSLCAVASIGFNIGRHLSLQEIIGYGIGWWALGTLATYVVRRIARAGP